MKKFVTLFSTLVLFGCTTTAYKISDEDMKKYITMKNDLAQCINPMLTNQIAWNSLPQLEKDIHTNFRLENLKSIIGYSNYNIMYADVASIQYFLDKFNRLNHYENGNTITAELCTAYKSKYNKEISQKYAEEVAHTQAKEMERQAQLRRQKAEQAFYQTSQGQAYLAQQRLLQQQMFQAIMTRRNDYREYKTVCSKTHPYSDTVECKTTR